MTEKTKLCDHEDGKSCVWCIGNPQDVKIEDTIQAFQEECMDDDWIEGGCDACGGDLFFFTNPDGYSAWCCDECECVDETAGY